MPLALEPSKMTFIRDLHSLQSFNQRSVVTIGSFDGVHLGHQAILNQVKAVAAELGLLSVVMTFEPQPQEFFSGEEAPARLMRLREKVDALLDFGVDHVLCLQFNRELRNLTAMEFVQSVLVDGLGTKCLIVGDDFRFGCDRSGDFEMLLKMGETSDFTVQDTETLAVDGERVSSTLVRQILRQGNLIALASYWASLSPSGGALSTASSWGGNLAFPRLMCN